MPTRLQIAAPDIKSWFDQGPRVLTLGQIESGLRENRGHWRLAQATTVQNFIEFLKKKFAMEECRIKLPNRPTIRYIWGSATVYEIVQSLRPNGYFSHYSAMYLHGLTEQIPKVIYYNFEQPASGGGGTLTQAAIDRAFKNNCRVTNNTALVRERKLFGLNGQNTGELGVVDFDGPEGRALRVTNVERTLIDITVRPIYSGGVSEVAHAFVAAKGKMSLNRLLAYLKTINFTYPYHQALGYYLERSGHYTSRQLAPLKALGIEFDFYLTYRMADTDYDPSWRLHVPKGF